MMEEVKATLKPSSKEFPQSLKLLAARLCSSLAILVGSLIKGIHQTEERNAGECILSQSYVIVNRRP